MSIFIEPELSEAKKRAIALIEHANKVIQGTESRVISLFKECWSLEEEKPEEISEEDWQTHKEQCIADDQAMLNEAGSQALTFFQWHGKAQELLALDPNYEIMSCPYNYVINEDGTITLSLKEDGPQE
jgi:hypothetical protein